MTYNELNTLFETIATAMGLSYEEGGLNQLNTVLRDVNTKYPICYSLRFIQVFDPNKSDTPEDDNISSFNVQLLFLDINETKQAPDTNNADKRNNISRQFEYANQFKYNLKYGSLAGLDAITFKFKEINALDRNQGMNGEQGAVLEFSLTTLADYDCQELVV